MSKNSDATKSKVWLGLGGIVLLGVGIYLTIQFDLIQQINTLLNEKTPTWLFLVLMAILPIVGFPISPFLILAGIKFSLVNAFLITLGLMAVHMLLSYLLARYVLRKPIESMLNRWDYKIPTVPEDRRIPYTFFFAALPGMPYAIKNYALALADVPFTIYLIFNGGVQFLWCIPFIVLGESASEMNYWYFLLFFLLMLGVYGLGRWLKKRFGHEYQ